MSPPSVAHPAINSCDPFLTFIKLHIQTMAVLVSDRFLRITLHLDPRCQTSTLVPTISAPFATKLTFNHSRHANCAVPPTSMTPDPSHTRSFHSHQIRTCHSLLLFAKRPSPSPFTPPQYPRHISPNSHSTNSHHANYPASLTNETRPTPNALLSFVSKSHMSLTPALPC